jgi:archaellum component FlaC
VYDLSGRRRLVLFDQTQNERGRLDSTYSDLGQLLRDNDYDVEPYTEFMILPKKLEGCSVMVLGCPNSSKLRQAEIDALRKFVRSGGGLFLLSLSGGDRGLMNNMSSISEAYGISFENSAVKDDRNNTGLPTMPLIKDFSGHAITSNIENILVPSACSLKVTDKATVVAKTSDTADPPSHPIIAAAEFGKGRILCAGSYEVFRRGSGLGHQGNITFALNAFRWLSGRDTNRDEKGDMSMTAEKPKSPEQEPAVSKEMEQTLRRLVNAVFDLQKDISKLTKQVSGVEGNIEQLRNQFQEFAEKIQGQLGLMIPSRQFRTDGENQTADIEADIESLEAELRSVEQLLEYINQRYSSGAMPKEAYDEQSRKLDQRIEDLSKKIEQKKSKLRSPDTG